MRDENAHLPKEIHQDRMQKDHDTSRDNNFACDTGELARDPHLDGRGEGVVGRRDTVVWVLQEEEGFCIVDHFGVLIEYNIIL